ncbi:hypothetical protein INH39_33070 [Massilia violaceinigra]|uniref:Uncharacterized protein n=1 Tax=Massilia violaceinigra TaxID=2045208 RepID=A0ABY4A5V1_9BURK|nr:hypothetical protein [Massilia violaceinigra]UOD30121.1 hypothetical protein INH39_33070 [Massilia violaceinigra]
MNLKIKDLKDLYKDARYMALQQDLFSQLQIESDGEPCTDLCKLDLQGMSAAELNLPQVKAILYDEYEKVKKYVLEKMNALSGQPTAQEYPENELPDDDDVAFEMESLEENGAPDNFLFGHLVEYAIIRLKPDRLIEYLKVNDIPFARKFEKELMAFFETSQDS